jgi:hypothetical protein
VQAQHGRAVHLDLAGPDSSSDRDRSFLVGADEVAIEAMFGSVREGDRLVDGRIGVDRRDRTENLRFRTFGIGAGDQGRREEVARVGQVRSVHGPAHLVAGLLNGHLVRNVTSPPFVSTAERYGVSLCEMAG